jgi:hypothetical protein
VCAALLLTPLPAGRATALRAQSWMVTARPGSRGVRAEPGHLPAVTRHAPALDRGVFAPAAFAHHKRDGTAREFKRSGNKSAPRHRLRRQGWDTCARTRACPGAMVGDFTWPATGSRSVESPTSPATRSPPGALAPSAATAEPPARTSIGSRATAPLPWIPSHSSSCTIRSSPDTANASLGSSVPLCNCVSRTNWAHSECRDRSRGASRQMLGRRAVKGCDAPAMQSTSGRRPTEQ